MINNIKTHYSTLINIDSAFRNKYPKHIYESQNRFLPSNPLYLKKGSNIVQINYPKHGLSSGDNIIIQNVEGINKTLADSFYLINKFKYLVIVFNNNMIDSDYKQYTNNLTINIELIDEQTESNILNNIPFNSLIGIKNVYLANDIPESNLSNVSSSLSAITETDYSLDYLNKHCLFVELDYEYINQSTNYIKLDQVFKITYLHIGGTKLGYFNSNYPINNYNYQSSYLVNNIIDENNFDIVLNFNSYGTIYGGGDKIQIMKIVNSITGYPDANSYVINLKKTFNNVVKIELVSSEFPYVDIVIKKDINDKLYWKHIEDGNVLYSIQLDDGNYTQQTLIDNIKTKMDSLERVGSTNTNKKFNNFDVILDMKLQLISFYPYNLINIPNSLSLRLETINADQFYILTISNKNIIVSKGDTVTISASDDVTLKTHHNNNIEVLLIASSYINKDHIIYDVNLENQNYDVIIGKKSEIKTTAVNYDYDGGENILIKTKTKVSFYFDKFDTCGEILGFKYTGDSNSIINYDSIITNKDSYINSNNLNFVGNELGYSNGFINLSGKYNYFLMYLNDIEYIYVNNNLSSAFAKILLDGNPGDILFDTFVRTPVNIYSKNFPILTLTDITIKFLYPDGTNVNFRNLDHSFTLNIVEEKIQNSNTYLNSNNISVVEEFKNANLN